MTGERGWIEGKLPHVIVVVLVSRGLPGNQAMLSHPTTICTSSSIEAQDFDCIAYQHWHAICLPSYPWSYKLIPVKIAYVTSAWLSIVWMVLGVTRDDMFLSDAHRSTHWSGIESSCRAKAARLVVIMAPAFTSDMYGYRFWTFHACQ